MRLAWRVLANADSDEVYDTVVDAETGEVLRRATRWCTRRAARGITTRARPSGGTQTPREFTATGWLPSGDELIGPFARVFADLNDNDGADDDGEEIMSTGNELDATWSFTPSLSRKRSVPRQRRPAPGTDNGPAGSWQTNLRQNERRSSTSSTRFHDWLEADPNRFDDRRNFEGNDYLVADVRNGAGTGAAAFSARTCRTTTT